MGSDRLRGWRQLYIPYVGQPNQNSHTPSCHGPLDQCPERSTTGWSWPPHRSCGDSGLGKPLWGGVLPCHEVISRSHSVGSTLASVRQATDWLGWRDDHWLESALSRFLPPICFWSIYSHSACRGGAHWPIQFTFHLPQPPPSIQQDPGLLCATSSPLWLCHQSTSRHYAPQSMFVLPFYTWKQSNGGIHQWFAAGRIRPSSSLARAGFFFVEKKDKSLRLCSTGALITYL